MKRQPVGPVSMNCRAMSCGLRGTAALRPGGRRAVGADGHPHWLPGLALPLLLLLAAASPAPAQTNWAVRDAEIRFEVTVARASSDPCAGVVVILPDGGLLPRGAPNPTVLDENGKELPSECLWHNPQEGLGLVFQPPPAGQSVFIYLLSAPQLKVGTPQSPFCPSLLLYTAPGDSLEDARRLGADRPPSGPRSRLGPVDNIALRENPFGPDDKYISYYSGYLKIEKPGRYQIATISDEGSECRLDGKIVASWPGLHTRAEGAKGQKGGPVDLTAGRHRLEYFQFEVKGDQEMHLVWKTPEAKPDALPETVPSRAFVHSGTARIVGVQRRDGVPAAVFRPEAERYLWLAEQPITLYRLQAAEVGGTTTKGAVYTWDFGGGLRLQTNACLWPVEGLEPRDVQLTVSLLGRQYLCQRQAYFDQTPAAASVNEAFDRAAFREALLARCLAAPAGRRPCADWTVDHWATLLGVVRPYEDGVLPLLSQVFERSRADVLTLKKEERWYLEDVFIDLLEREAATPADRDRVQRWLGQLLRDETDKLRRFQWQLAGAEFQLYELHDPATARKTIEGLYQSAVAVGVEAAVRLDVRYGDIARLQGRYADAQTIYSQAQDKYRQKTPDWRTEAVRESSYYKLLLSLLEQEDYSGARDILRKWELEFPLSKLSGDYPLAEARYWQTVGRADRAVTVLQTYRQSTDLSPFLAQAMEMELDCLIDLRRTDDLKALAADIQRRFPKLPLAEKARDALDPKPQRLP